MEESHLCKTQRIQGRKLRGLSKERGFSKSFHTLKSSLKDFRPLEKIGSESISEKDKKVIFPIIKNLSRLLIPYPEGISRCSIREK